MDKVHFIGIGGISMSALAEILLRDNKPVSGSDIHNTEVTRRLTQMGAIVYEGHSAENISEDVTLVVYTAAIKQDNEELQYARSKGIETMERARYLGILMKNYAKSSAVAGTHGKTTTTGMLSEMMILAGNDPTVLIGGNLKEFGNVRVGQSDYFVAEACEYCDSFLHFEPLLEIILNVDLDHTDYFKSEEQERNSFKCFCDSVPSHGAVIINTDINNYAEIVSNIKAKLITYGLDNNAKWQAKNIEYNSSGHGSFDVYCDNTFMGHLQLQVPGTHNVTNALSCFAAGNFYGMDTDSIIRGIEGFTGVKRRFEYKGTFKGMTIVDDYGHHPTEIKTTLLGAKNREDTGLWCVFQPHTYTRTKSFLDDFAESLSIAGKIILTDIYAAREKDTGEIHSKDLYEKIAKRGKEVYYISGFDEIVDFIKENGRPGDLVITMGAGNINIVGEKLLESI